MIQHLGVLTSLKIASAKILGRKRILRLNISGINHPVYIRNNSSDFKVLYQIFCEKEYEFKFGKSVSTILDAGSNIGLTTVFLKSRFPDAIVCCVEPEKGNYELLEMNTISLNQVYLYRAALWKKNTRIDIQQNPGGDWAFSVVEKENNGKIKTITVDQILQDRQLEQFDIVKMDIEGSEKEVFQGNTNWLFHSKHVVIETHDRMKPGSSKSLLEKINQYNFNLEVKGELLHFYQIN